jgi:hypothetical protein
MVEHDLLHLFRLAENNGLAHFFDNRTVDVCVASFTHCVFECVSLANTKASSAHTIERATLYIPAKNGMWNQGTTTSGRGTMPLRWAGLCRRTGVLLPLPFLLPILPTLRP